MVADQECPLYPLIPSPSDMNAAAAASVGSGSEESWVYSVNL